MQKSKEQGGFVIIEAILAVLLIAAIGTAGYFAYQAHHNKADTVSTAKTSTTAKTTTSASAPANDFITIKEWGVKAKYDGSLTLKYVMDSSVANTADFTSSQLAASDPACNDPAAGAAITRYLPGDQVVGEGAAAAGSNGGTAAEVAANTDKSRYAFVGGYYYFVSGPQSPCGNSQASYTVETQTTQAVDSLLSVLQAD